MPQVNVQGFGRVHFPDVMSPEQIDAAIRRDIVPQMQGASSAQGPAAAVGVGQPAQAGPTAPTAWQSFKRGALDIGDRLTQLNIAAGEALGLPSYPKGLGDIATAQMNREAQQYEQSRGLDAGIDWPRIGGNATAQAPLMLLPGGGQAALARAGMGALSGALSGALQYDESNTLAGTAKNAAVGAGVGGVAAPMVGAVADKVPAVASAVAGRLKGLIASGKDPVSIAAAVPEIAALPAEAQRSLIEEAQAMIKRTGTLNGEQLARKANLIANNVQPTRSMVTRSPTDWTRERNLQKLAQSPDEQIAATGEELTSLYQRNNQALTSRLESFSDGLPKGSAEQHGQAVMRKLSDLADASQREVSKVYADVRDQVGEELASDARRVIETLSSPDVADNAYAESTIKSITARLKRYGMIDDKGAPTSQSMTVSQAEEFRKFLGSLKDGADPREARIVQQFIRATDEDVLSGYGSQAFGGARAAARDRFAMLDNPSTQRALNAWGELQQGKTAQGFIRSQIVNGSEQDVRSLIATLSKLPQDQSVEALGALKAGLLDHLQSKSINSSSGQFSGTGLNKALTEIGEDKLRAVLGVDQLKQLKSLARAGLDATYQPSFSAVNNSNTAPMLLSLTQRARTVPGVPLLVTDESAKMAARAGYRGQLNDALAAKATANTPPSLWLEQFRRALPTFSAAAPPAGNALLDQKRKRSNDRK